MNRGDATFLISILSPIFTILGVAYHNAKRSGQSAEKTESFERDINALQLADVDFASFKTMQCERNRQADLREAVENQRDYMLTQRVSMLEGREDGRKHNEK